MICTILLNESCGVVQGSTPTGLMSGTDPARSPQLSMSCRSEPKCWMKKHVCGQCQKFLLSNRASKCWVPSGSRGFRAGFHRRETQCIVSNNPDRDRFPVHEWIKRIGTAPWQLQWLDPTVVLLSSQSTSDSPRPQEFLDPAILLSQSCHAPPT